MKKKVNTPQTFFRSLKLSREDLEEIINILSSENEKLIIEDNEYTFDSLHDLEK